MIYHRRTSDLEELENEIYVEMPEATSAFAIAALKDSAVRFCENSLFWQEDIGPVRVGNTSSCEVYTAGYCELVSIMRVSVVEDGEEIVFERSHSQIPGEYTYWPASMESIDVLPVDSLRGKDLSVIAAVRPKRGEDFELSTTVLADYRDVILDGAKANLYRRPRKEWTDLNLSRQHQEQFEHGCRRALRHQAQGFSRTPMGSARKPRPVW